MRPSRTLAPSLTLTTTMSCPLLPFQNPCWPCSWLAPGLKSSLLIAPSSSSRLPRTSLGVQSQSAASPLTRLLLDTPFSTVTYFPDSTVCADSICCCAALSSRVCCSTLSSRLSRPSSTVQTPAAARLPCSACLVLLAVQTRSAVARLPRTPGCADSICCCSAAARPCGLSRYCAALTSRVC